MLIKYLKANQLIEEATLESSQVLTLKRKNKRNLRVHLTNTYIVGDADAHEILSEDPNVDAIVTMSQWNGYTHSAKASCKDRGVGLFKFGEFLGAVSYDGDKFWITRLRALKNAKSVIDAGGGKLFLFGSALVLIEPGDIDLLFVYDKNGITAGEACSARRTLNAIFAGLGKPVSICLLSNVEAESSTFIFDEGCRLVWERKFNILGTKRQLTDRRSGLSRQVPR